MSCESRAASGWLPRARTRTPAVKRLLVWIEALLTAVAFAEEGEPDTARRIAEGCRARRAR